MMLFPQSIIVCNAFNANRSQWRSLIAACKNWSQGVPMAALSALFSRNVMEACLHSSSAMGNAPGSPFVLFIWDVICH